MKKGFTIFIAVIVAVCLISMISVSANDTGYGQFGKIYFGATSDEATFDEASFDEASLDEASPDEWWAYTDIYETSAKKYYLGSSRSSNLSNDMQDIVNKNTSKKAVVKKNTVADTDDNQYTANTKVKKLKTKGSKKQDKSTPKIKKINTTVKNTANVATQQKPNFIGWILMGMSIAGIVVLLIVAAKKRAT